MKNNCSLLLRTAALSYLLVLVLGGCSDSSVSDSGAGVSPEGQAPADFTGSPQPAEENPAAVNETVERAGPAAGAPEGGSLPSQAEAREPSAVPEVADPNVPALPDENLAAGQPVGTQQDTAGSLGRAPVTDVVPGSPTVVTPELDADEAAGEEEASAALQTEQ